VRPNISSQTLKQRCSLRVTARDISLSKSTSPAHQYLTRERGEDRYGGERLPPHIPQENAGWPGESQPAHSDA